MAILQDLDTANISSGDGYAVRTVTSDSGQTSTVAVITDYSEGAHEEGVNIDVVSSEGEQAEVSVNVPTAALESVADGRPVFMAASVMDQDDTLFETGKDEGQVQAQGIPAVNMVLYDDNGERILVEDLTEPILITLAENVSERDEELRREGKLLRCAYWNEEVSDWDTSGVVRQEDGSGRLVCATTHLSCFSAIVDVYLCSNAGALFTWEAWHRVGRGKWRGEAVPVVIWCFLILAGLVMLICCVVDWRTQQKISRESQQDLRDTLRKDLRTSAILAAGVSRGMIRQLASFCDIRDLPQKLVSHCVVRVQGILLNTDWKTLDKLLDVLAGQARTRRMAQLKRRASVLKGHRDLLKEADMALEQCLEASFFKRVMWLLMSSHPVWRMCTFCERLSHFARAFLITLKIVWAAGGAAFFFNSKAPALEADPSCPDKETMEPFARFLQIVVISVSCSFTSHGLLFMLLAIRVPSASLEDDNELPMEEPLRATLFWSLGIGAMFFALYCVVAFLASVPVSEHEHFIHSFLFVLAQNFFVQPLLLALLLGSLLTMMLRWVPDVKWQVLSAKRRLRRLSMEAQREEGSPRNSEKEYTDEEPDAEADLQAIEESNAANDRFDGKDDFVAIMPIPGTLNEPPK